MASLPARISESARRIFQIAAGKHQQRRFWKQTNVAFASLRADHEAWAEEERERKAWEPTIGDDLHEPDVWSE